MLKGKNVDNGLKEVESSLKFSFDAWGQGELGIINEELKIKRESKIPHSLQNLMSAHQAKASGQARTKCEPAQDSGQKHILFLNFCFFCFKTKEEEKMFFKIHRITDANQLVTEEYSFDAWGQRRNPDNWQDYSLSTINYSFTRGYTGHEHLDMFALINMNGRVYDPEIGRFLSPDPYIQLPDFTQNYNRYSYVLNNPLMYTDPSGEIVVTFTVIVITAIVVNGTINVATHWDNIMTAGGGWNSFGKGALYFTAGGINGALSAYGHPVIGNGVQETMNALIGGETLDKALIKGGTGAISTYVGGKAGKFISGKIYHGLKGKINDFGRNMISEIGTSMTVGSGSTFLKSTLIEGKSIGAAGKDVIKGLPSMVASGTFSGISKTMFPIRTGRTKPVDHIEEYNEYPLHLRKVEMNPPKYETSIDIQWKPSLKSIQLPNRLSDYSLYKTGSIEFGYKWNYLYKYE